MLLKMNATVSFSNWKKKPLKVLGLLFEVDGRRGKCIEPFWWTENSANFANGSSFTGVYRLPHKGSFRHLKYAYLVKIPILFLNYIYSQLYAYIFKPLSGYHITIFDSEKVIFAKMLIFWYKKTKNFITHHTDSVSVHKSIPKEEIQAVFF